MSVTDIWSGKTVDITSTSGDDRWFKPPSGKPSFRLKRYDPDNSGQLSWFHVEYDQANMTDCWYTAWLLRLGPGAPRLQYKDRRYVDRLEGFMQVVADGKPRTDHILMEYWQAFTGKLSDDLVVVYLSYADAAAHVREEGGGSGPPH